MTTIDHMAEQHILEHQARLKHFDELLSRAEKGISKVPELDDELAQLQQEREKLMNHIKLLKQQALEEWQEETIEEAGPMIIWEAVAKRLENLVERLEG